MAQMAAVDVKSAVCRVYGTVAVREDGSQQEGARRVAQAFGYSVPPTKKMPFACCAPSFTDSISGSLWLFIETGGGTGIDPAGGQYGPLLWKFCQVCQPQGGTSGPSLQHSGSGQQHIITAVLRALLLRVKWWWIWGVGVVWTASSLPRKVRAFFFCLFV